jgi:lauroyl/myristoyl acyltransferase
MPREIISGKDILETILLVLLAVGTVFCHPKNWERFSFWLSGVRRFYTATNVNPNAETAAQACSWSASEKTKEDCARKFLSYTLEARMQILDGYLRKRWVPEITVSGVDRLDLGLAAGKGVILWVVPTLFSDLVTKMEFNQLGYQVNHLSRPAHGYSVTRYGIACLNPVKISIEERHVACRVVLHDDEEAKAVLQLRKLLRKNAVVSITVMSNPASQGLVRSMGLGLRVSTGPLRLSATTGAPLLPVFTMRKDDGSYHVAIEDPLIHGENSRKKGNWSEELQRFGEMLEKQIVLDPIQLRYSYLG